MGAASTFKFEKPDSKWDVPAGLYKVRFIEIKETNHPEYGAGMKWVFEVVEGPYAKKLVERTTPPTPTPKNACGRMISDIVGGAFKEGQEIDIAPYIGRLYRAKVEPNSTGTGVRVGSVMPLDDAPAVPATSAPSPQRPAAPPARRPAPAAGIKPHLAASWWMQTEDDEQPQGPVTGETIQNHILEKGLKASSVSVMPADQSRDWTTADKEGFEDSPF